MLYYLDLGVFHKQDDSNMENIDYEEFFTDFHEQNVNEATNIENIDYEQLFTEFYSGEENKKEAEPNIPVQQIDPVQVNPKCYHRFNI